MNCIISFICHSQRDDNNRNREQIISCQELERVVGRGMNLTKKYSMREIFVGM